MTHSRRGLLSLLGSSLVAAPALSFPSAPKKIFVDLRHRDGSLETVELVVGETCADEVDEVEILSLRLGQ